MRGIGSAECAILGHVRGLVFGPGFRAQKWCRQNGPPQLLFPVRLRLEQDVRVVLGRCEVLLLVYDTCFALQSVEILRGSHVQRQLGHLKQIGRS